MTVDDILNADFMLGGGSDDENEDLEGGDGVGDF
jgi:hypothetical protein